MSSETLSKRKTAQELGISQSRVRELIEKGRLDAEKVSDGSGSRWEISRASIEAFREDRDGRGDNGSRPAAAGNDGRAAAGASGAATSHLAALLPELEQQLDRVKTLIEEISRAQAYLEGLRETQRRLEEEIDSVRSRVDDPSEPAAEEAEDTATPPEPAEDGGEGTTSSDSSPEGQAKNGGKRTIRKGETPVAAALRDAGVDAETGSAGAKKTSKKKPSRSKGSSKGKKTS